MLTTHGTNCGGKHYAIVLCVYHTDVDLALLTKQAQKRDSLGYIVGKLAPGHLILPPARLHARLPIRQQSPHHLSTSSALFEYAWVRSCSGSLIMVSGIIGVQMSQL